ncbi:MAG: tetratricopeptide repeat protein [Bacteroidaceae bacterium]|nr:tetratricopeptide repeat protein [Bacteroidaceae bacterium]
MKRLFFIFLTFAFCSVPSKSQTLNEHEKAIVDGIVNTIRTKPVDAKKEAEVIIQKNKRNANLIFEILTSFITAGRSDEADELSDALYDAIKEGPGRSRIYVIRGDILASQKNVEGACEQYNRAIYIAPKEEMGYNRYAETLLKTSPEKAISKLDELIKNRPDLESKVSKRIAHLYYTADRFDEAADAYDRVDPAAMDEDDIIEQAMAEWFNRDFTRSLAAAEAGHAKNPRKVEFNRLMMFNNTDLKNYSEALKAADNLFNKSDKQDFSFLDYTYYGYALMGIEDYEKAIVQFNKALELNDGRSDVMAKLSEAYEEMGDFKKALELYNQFMNSLQPDQRTLEVTFRLGRLYYTHASHEGISAAEKKSTLMSADSVFTIVAKLAPNSHMGNFWRARTNSLLDPESEQGLAKPYYEAVADLLEEKNDPARYGSTLMECYRYLGYYYLLKKNKTNSIYYWQQVLQLDPENSIAKRAMEFLQ